MDASPHNRGLDLIAAHCTSLDPASEPARKRLDDALGPELARKLVFALSCGGAHQERSRGFSGAGPVFAA
jgi:hypothetical protein